MSDFEQVDLDDFLEMEDSDSENPGVHFEEVDIAELGLSEELLRAASHRGEDSVVALMDQAELQGKIAHFYLHRQLEKMLIDTGSIPQHPVETMIGIGFFDIVKYSYLSKWLSPRENQLFLNGLYSAFHTVLKRKGGFLNKITGDSLMFHYGGNIDSNTREQSVDEQRKYISKALFETCVEMQRVCYLFNDADTRFLDEVADSDDKEAIQEAFSIIQNLRQNMAMVSSLNVMFQVQIRVGASIGEVCMGNFGPEGVKQWDIIGEPVIEAQRMESTAPIGGIRISEKLYEALDEYGFIKEYYRQFKQIAGEGFFGQISIDELFSFSEVVLKDKNNAVFPSFSVQAQPRLPEIIRKLVETYLENRDSGPDEICELLSYYRGNRLVIKGIEELFKELGVPLRKVLIFKVIFPAKYKRLFKKFDGHEEQCHSYVHRHFSLYNLFQHLGQIQDRIKSIDIEPLHPEEPKSFDRYLDIEFDQIDKDFSMRKKSIVRKIYFYNIVFPRVFAIIRGSILEYQGWE